MADVVSNKEVNKEEKEVKKVTCYICLEEDVQNPIFTPCIHGYCRNCLSEWINQNKQNRKIPCPFCKYDIAELAGYRNESSLYEDDDDLPPLGDLGLGTPDFGMLTLGLIGLRLGGQGNSQGNSQNQSDTKLELESKSDTKTNIQQPDAKTNIQPSSQQNTQVSNQSDAKTNDTQPLVQLPQNNNPINTTLMPTFFNGRFRPFTRFGSDEIAGQIASIFGPGRYSSIPLIPREQLLRDLGIEELEISRQEGKLLQEPEPLPEQLPERRPLPNLDSDSDSESMPELDSDPESLPELESKSTTINTIINTPNDDQKISLSNVVTLINSRRRQLARHRLLDSMYDAFREQDVSESESRAQILRSYTAQLRDLMLDQ